LGLGLGLVVAAVVGVQLVHARLLSRHYAEDVLLPRAVVVITALYCAAVSGVILDVAVQGGGRPAAVVALEVLPRVR
jgi:hypothetical protein